MAIEPGFLKSQMGLKSALIHDEVLPERLQKFAQAVDAQLVSDEAPVTFYTVFRDGEFALLSKLGISLANVLHADQEYSYELPLRVSEKVEYITELVQVLEKRGRGGAMSFLTFETSFRSLKYYPEKVLGRARSLIIYREPT